MAATRGSVPSVPEPLRVHSNVISHCRRLIDPPLKRQIRKLLNWYYSHKYKLHEVGEGVQFGRIVQIPAGSRLGHYSYVGAGFYAPSPISVGDLCMISTDVKIVATDHGTDNPELPTRLDFRWAHKITVFEADVWIGHGVTIISGVKIGTGSVVATGSVVTRDIPPNSIAAGIPAKVIKSRFDEKSFTRYLKILNLDELKI